MEMSALEKRRILERKIVGVYQVLKDFPMFKMLFFRFQ